MELRSGYRQTEVGVIPEEWELAKLGDLGECLIGLTYTPSQVRRHGTLVLRSSNIQNDVLAFEDNVYVEANIPARIMVRPNDILICVRNGSRDLIGKAALLDERTIGMTFGAFMAVYRSQIGPLVHFLLQSRLMKRQIDEHLGATINQITNRSLGSFFIPLPPSDLERWSIVVALSDMDALLGKLSRLIAKKRDLKQGAMQQLLTGRARLPGFRGEWMAKRLRELGPFLKGSGIRRDQARSGAIPCVRYGELYTTYHDVIRFFTSHISPLVAKTATRLRFGDLLFAGSGETKEEIGRCAALAMDVEAYAGGDIVILRPKIGNPVFLGYVMNTPPVVRQKANLGQGDAVVHISASALGGIEIILPDRDEQDAIAAVLSDMDAEIATLSAQATKMRALKQAMMQALLTGRVRLPLPTKEDVLA